VCMSWDFKTIFLWIALLLLMHIIHRGDGGRQPLVVSAIVGDGQ
jgi:hypothetical protein